MRLANLVLVALSGVVLLGCRRHRAWTEEDTWYRPPPSPEQTWSGSVVDPSRLYEVTQDRLPDAERMLEESSAIALAHEDAISFVGEEVVEAPGTSPFLVRGLYLHKATGRFSVNAEGDALFVHHGCLGSGPTTMKRQPLVVFLEKAPNEVYVTVSMAR